MPNTKTVEHILFEKKTKYQRSKQHTEKEGYRRSKEEERTYSNTKGKEKVAKKREQKIGKKFKNTHIHRK